jgi:hypothetical protein
MSKIFRNFAENTETMKSAYKYELAAAAGVSDRTFRRWLSAHRGELLNLGVKTTDKLLPPRAVEWICREYGIDYAEVA